jgi:hypothetical protein
MRIYFPLLRTMGAIGDCWRVLLSVAAGRSRPEPVVIQLGNWPLGLAILCGRLGGLWAFRRN